MGNCLRHDESPATWAGDDWWSPESDETEPESSKLYEEGRRTTEILLLGEKKRSASGCTETEVKIKMTKKQLEELVGRLDVEGLSVEQILAQLMSVSDQYCHTHQRSWRPALQSIPEVN